MEEKRTRRWEMKRRERERCKVKRRRENSMRREEIQKDAKRKRRVYLRLREARCCKETKERGGRKRVSVASRLESDEPRTSLQRSPREARDERLTFKNPMNPSVEFPPPLIGP